MTHEQRMQEITRLVKDSIAPHVTAAKILELLGPKPLVWKRDQKTPVWRLYGPEWYRFGTDLNGVHYSQTPDGEADHDTLDAARDYATRHAQAHYDAAHWAGTVIG